jgi:hypothetical protein
MRRRPQPGIRLLPAVVLLGAAAALHAAPAAGAAPSAGGPGGGPVTVPSSSGSMAGPDGPGRTRIESARAAAGAAVDGRQLVRAPQPGADSYRTAGATAATAAALAPGQYTDTIGPGETRWYAVTLDAASTADLSATAAPQPGVPADYGDGLELKLAGTGSHAFHGTAVAGSGRGDAAPPPPVAAPSGGGGLKGMDLVAAGTGGATALAGLGAAALVRRLRSRRTRGGA